MSELSFDLNRLTGFLTGLLNTPSPTGCCADALTFVEDAFRALPIPHLDIRRSPKGTLILTWPGRDSTAPRGLTAHVDTLGLMVKEIKSSGRLRTCLIGGYMWNAVEFEGVTVRTWDGRRYRGTVVPIKASVHIHRDARDMTRAEDTMEIRLDARVSTAEETRALGIEVGDFVALDPRVEISDTGFVRSRHLDDKAGVAAIYEACAALADAGLVPAQSLTIVIAQYEEVGHGAAEGWPTDLAELVAVDMAAVGQGQNSDEFSVGICVKDSGGPYDPALIARLRTLAEAHNIPYKTDIYSFYGSDGGVYWRTGGSAQVALIGPGVDASHGYERTHQDSLLHTTHLIARYILA